MVAQSDSMRTAARKAPSITKRRTEQNTTGDEQLDNENIVSDCVDLKI